MPSVGEVRLQYLLELCQGCTANLWKDRGREGDIGVLKDSKLKFTHSLHFVSIVLQLEIVGRNSIRMSGKVTRSEVKNHIQAKSNKSNHCWCFSKTVLLISESSNIQAARYVARNMPKPCGILPDYRSVGVQSLKSVQRRASKLLLGMRSLSYEEFLNKLNLRYSLQESIKEKHKNWAESMTMRWFQGLWNERS